MTLVEEDSEISFWRFTVWRTLFDWPAGRAAVRKQGSKQDGAHATCQAISAEKVCLITTFLQSQQRNQPRKGPMRHATIYPIRT
jgi:hypothetical protein